MAAELGKTLLERNKELEQSLRNQQTVVDDQLQEIEVSNIFFGVYEWVFELTTRTVHSTNILSNISI